MIQHNQSPDSPGRLTVSIFPDSWDQAWLFAPLVYIAILSHRDEPAQRLVALVESVAQLVQSIADMIGRLKR